jgi:hypothetical protein
MKTEGFQPFFFPFSPQSLLERYPKTIGTLKISAKADDKTGR